MKLRRPGYRSANVEDRRDGSGGGGGMGFPLPGGGMKAGGIGAVVLAIIGAIIGGAVISQGGGGGGFDITNTLEDLSAPPASQGEGIPAEADPDADLVEFVNLVFDDIQAAWDQEFARAGSQYQLAQLVLFDDAVSTGGCGNASSAVGPFYCPADETVYIDLAFFRDLANRYDAPGDFAQAYVIAHEVGHHIQNITGLNAQVSQQQRQDPDNANELSVRVELQADCLAGVWAYTAYQRDLLEPGDIEEGLAAAAAVGDDRLQQQATGQVNPETWTHGSSDQRQEWFTRGFEEGTASACDTFGGGI